MNGKTEETEATPGPAAETLGHAESLWGTVSPAASSQHHCAVKIKLSVGFGLSFLDGLLKC